MTWIGVWGLQPSWPGTGQIASGAVPSSRSASVADWSALVVFGVGGPVWREWWRLWWWWWWCRLVLSSSITESAWVKWHASWPRRRSVGGVPNVRKMWCPKTRRIGRMIWRKKCANYCTTFRRYTHTGNFRPWLTDGNARGRRRWWQRQVRLAVYQ